MTGNPITDFKVPLNSASSSLDGAITDADVTLDVATGDGDNFPATADGDFWVSIDAEILLCTARAPASDTLTVTRAQQGTAAAAHDDGAAVELRITQEAIEDIHASIVTGVLQGWADDTNLNPSIGTLPANSFVWRVDIWVQELFDAGNQLVDVGYDALNTHLVNTFDVSGVIVDHIDDDAHADAGAGIGVVEATARDIEIYVDAAASTTGRVYVVVHYIVANTQPA